jgi:adenosine deaminase/aminodeoxyfutalosine deaminase
VKKFFDEGLMVTLSTDDPAMFQTSLNKEYEIAQQEFNFSEEHLRELARNSIEASFLPVERKLKLLSQIDFLV